VIDRHADEQNSDPGGNAADDLGIGGAERPAELGAGKIAKHTEHF